VKRHRYDLVVIGAGSGGYAAARTARDLGANVALVDHGPLGGLCILNGCMPSKTLLATSDLVQAIRESGGLAVQSGVPTVDLTKLIARKREVIAGFADYRIEGINTFPLLPGRRAFSHRTEVQVGDDEILEAGSFVVGTGSIVAPPVFPGLAEAGYIDSDAALDWLERLPASLDRARRRLRRSELTQYFARIGVATTILIRSRTSALG
jgi:pyruvate/2-oxoglutarate dehydrogenase complex dihydrolipoamide dehydrogenase (E3) component